MRKTVAALGLFLVGFVLGAWLWPCSRGGQLVANTEIEVNYGTKEFTTGAGGTGEKQEIRRTVNLVVAPTRPNFPHWVITVNGVTYHAVELAK